VVVGALAAVVIALATPAFAQVGGVRGKVVDEGGKPVPDADVKFDYQGELRLHFDAKTDKNGVYLRAGLLATGVWTITVRTKDGMSGIKTNVSVPLGSVGTLTDLVVKAGPAPVNTANKAEVEAANKLSAELDTLSKEVNAAIDAKDYDTAITKLNEAIARVPTCKACFVWLGDSYNQKKDYAKAEDAYNKAIALDANLADAYDGLVSLYNQQKKFDEASKASAKAGQIRGASGGGTDAVSLYNQGVVFWNQSKIAEAKDQFQKAIAAKPDMAEAHYYLGMALLNEGKMAEARASLETYVKLAPTGPHAAEAKDMIPMLK
jgi:tetratricopeptide (TPR) repeat protein